MMTINTVLLLEAFTVVTIEKAHACITYYIQRTSKCLCNEWEDCVRRAILQAEAAVHATCGISRITDQLVGKVGRPSVVDPSIDRSIDRPSDRRLRIVHAMVAVVAVRGDEEGRGRRQSRKRLAGERTMDAKGRSVGRHTIDR